MDCSCAHSEQHCHLGRCWTSICRASHGLLSARSAHSASLREDGNAVMPQRTTALNRSSLRRRLLTIVAATIVLVALVLVQTRSRFVSQTWSRVPLVGGGVGDQVNQRYTYGWPAIALDCRTYDYNSPVLPLRPATDTSSWNPGGLVVNAVISMLLLVGTIASCQMLRKPHDGARFQFRLSSLFGFATVVSIILGFHLNEYRIYWWYGSTPTHSGLRGLPLLASVPLYCGIACLLFVTIRLLSLCVLRVAKHPHRRPRLPMSEHR